MVDLENLDRGFWKILSSGQTIQARVKYYSLLSVFSTSIGLKAKVEVASEKDPWLTCHQEFSSILLQLNKDASSKHKIEKKKLLLKSKYSTR